MEASKQVERHTLKGMAESDLLPPWETEWTVFGPIPNEGNPSSWPGEIGFDPLPLDAADAIPDEVEMLGQRYSGKAVRSIDGVLDFQSIFNYREGCPIAYALTAIEARQESRLPISFSANWGTRWWVNGNLAYETTEGSEGSPTEVSTSQFYAHVRPGRNVFNVRVVSGGPGWLLKVACLSPVCD